MIPFNGILDLRTTFENQSEARLRNTFLNRELPDVAFALQTTLPSNLSRERDRIPYLREWVRQMPDLKVRTCDCVVPSGSRWTRFDNEGAEPLKVYIDPSVPTAFRATIARVVVESHEIAYRFKAVMTTSEAAADVKVRYGEIDGPGGTLGVTTYYANQDNTIYEEQPIDVLIDRRDHPVTIDQMVFYTVFRHEFEHVKGHDHTPLDIEGIGNVLDTFYDGVFTGWGQWDRFVNKTKYGGVTFV